MISQLGHIKRDPNPRNLSDTLVVIRTDLIIKKLSGIRPHLLSIKSVGISYRSEMTSYVSFASIPSFTVIVHITAHSLVFLASRRTPS